jgi:heme o synthase
MGDTLRLMVSVSKLRIGGAIMLCALAGVAVSPGEGPGGWPLAVLALAVLLSSGCAGAFNHYVERDLDARMARTRGRPFVTGRLSPGWHWPLGLGLLLALAVVSAAIATNVVAALMVFLGAFTYGVVYTVWLKRRTVLNIVVGGAAGSFAVLAGAAAVDPFPGPAAAALAVVLFLWTPPHFWSLAFAYRRDYAEGGVPMLPVVVEPGLAARVILVHTVLLVACSLVPALFGMGWIYLAAALAGGGWFLVASLRLARRPGVATAMANFRASLGQLSLLLVGALVDALVLGG